MKEKDGTNVKARAFVKWLNLDIAQHSLDKELYHYTGVNWEILPRSELEVKAVQFYDEQEFTYSARLWGSDNIYIERNKKIWREKMRWSPCLWGFVVFRGLELCK